MEKQNRIPESLEKLTMEPDDEQAQRVANNIKGVVDYLQQNKVVKFLTFTAAGVALIYLSSFVMDALNAAAGSYKRLNKTLKE
jgi:hypothetical protein